MRRSLFVSIVIVLGVVAQNPALLNACGEKLLLLGRGIRFQSRHSPRPATVLMYLPQSGAGQPLTDPNLESALKEAGHDVRVATTSADLERALKSGGHDVVLANITDAPDLDQAVTAAHAVVLPAVYLVASGPQVKQRIETDRDNASKTFGVMVAVPGRPGHYCAAVDKAMELKLKRERAAGRRP